MQVNIKEFLVDADIKDALYPGKRVVKPCKQVGEYKNHCVVIDWRDPDTLSIDIRPGLTGKQLAPEMLKKYPVSFQMPTHVKIDIVNDNGDEEDEEKGKSGKGESGGGNKLAKKTLEEVEMIASRFGDSAEGMIPELGKIKEMVVMGVQIAQEAFESAFAELTRQIHHAHIATTEILAKAGDLVKRVKPPSFLEPKGDETESYKYDRDKNADIGFKLTLG